MTLLSILLGCRRPESPPASTVVLYCSVDETVATAVIESFSQRTGIHVQAIYDSEAGKTTGLVQRIIREYQSGRPGADVFWSGEIYNTMLLARDGLLEAFEAPAAADLPARFRDSQGRWVASAVRPRAVAFDPAKSPAASVPSRWEQFADPTIARRTAIANPLFGTTKGHVAALFAAWGEARGRAFLQRLRDGGVLMVDGNSAAVRAVLDGRAEFAWTDSDDVWMARRGGGSIDLRYPELEGGVLLTPGTIALVRGGPNAQAGRVLADFLASADVERALAQGEARHLPVREPLRVELGADWPPEAPLTFDAVADAMDEAETAVREILIR